MQKINMSGLEYLPMSDEDFKSSISLANNLSQSIRSGDLPLSMQYVFQLASIFENQDVNGGGIDG